jgi:hypothetical protein
MPSQRMKFIHESKIVNTQHFLTIIDTPPHSLKDSNASLKMKTTEKERVKVHSLVRNTSKVEGHVRAP